MKPLHVPGWDFSDPWSSQWNWATEPIYLIIVDMNQLFEEQYVRYFETKNHTWWQCIEEQYE